MSQTLHWFFYEDDLLKKNKKKKKTLPFALLESRSLSYLDEIVSMGNILCSVFGWICWWLRINCRSDHNDFFFQSLAEWIATSIPRTIHEEFLYSHPRLKISRWGRLRSKMRYRNNFMFRCQIFKWILRSACTEHSVGSQWYKASSGGQRSLRSEYSLGTRVIL